MYRTTTLRLILGDQLNPEHSWFRHRHDDVLYVMMEVRQETDYVLHHAQKIIAIFAGMRELARQQRAHHLVRVVVEAGYQSFLVNAIAPCAAGNLARQRGRDFLFLVSVVLYAGGHHDARDRHIQAHRNRVRAHHDVGPVLITALGTPTLKATLQPSVTGLTLKNGTNSIPYQIYSNSGNTTAYAGGAIVVTLNGSTLVSVLNGGTTNNFPIYV
eukprot:gene28959-32704_t